MEKINSFGLSILFQEDPRKLILLGSEPALMQAIDIDILVENKSMFIVVADASGNIHILAYAPYGTSLFFYFLSRIFFLSFCMADVIWASI